MVLEPGNRCALFIPLSMSKLHSFIVKFNLPGKDEVVSLHQKSQHGEANAIT